MVILLAGPDPRSAHVDTLFLSDRRGRDGAPRPSLLRVLATIFLALFILLSNIIFAAFKCLEHPNGQKTVAAYPQIKC